MFIRRSAVPLELTVAPKKKDDAGGRLIIIFHYFSKIKFPVQIIAISGPFTLCACTAHHCLHLETAWSLTMLHTK